MGNEQLRAPRTLRFGVFDPGTDKRVVTLLLDIDESTITCSGAVAGLEAAIRQAFEAFNPVQGAEPERHLVELLDGAAREAGLTIRRIRDSELVFNAQVDLATGLVLGRSDTSDGAEPLPPQLMKGILDSLRRAPLDLSDELAGRIATLVGSAGPAAAAAALAEANAEGRLGFGPSPQLGDVIDTVDVASLTQEESWAFLKLRAAIAVRLDRYDRASADAAVLLSSCPDLPTNLAAELRNVQAIAHARAGRNETAISIWVQLAYQTPGVASASRAQILRNLAFASPPGDRRSVRWLEEAHDAFLQAGERREAAISLVQLGDALEHHDANQAFATLAKAEALLDEPSLIGQALQGALQFFRAKRLSALDRIPEALQAALASVSIRRGLAGQEEELLASLALARSLAETAGDPCAADLASESDRILEEGQNERFLLGEMVDSLLTSWNPALAAKVQEAADAMGEPAAALAARTALIANDPGLSYEQRLAGFETLHDDALRSGLPGNLLTPVRLALAMTLRERNDVGRAAAWLQRALAGAPLARGVAKLLLSTLREAGDWSAVASVARRELTLKGESFDRLADLARGSLAAGLRDEAFRAARRARQLSDNPEQRTLADDLCEAAMEQGASIAAAPAIPVVTPVTTAELESALADYSRRVSADYRMEFWERDVGAKDHKWVAKPERRAQVQLRTWLDAAFGGRVVIIEEIPAGAGQLDLLVQLAGGTEVILELKMCGYGYSGAYAAAGADQIAHT